jgi:hypothetical protein
VAVTRLAEAVPGAGEVRPRIVGACQPGPDGGHGELAGVQAGVVHFRPAQRGGHRSARAAPDSVVGHYRLSVGIAHDIGVDTGPPLVLALLGGNHVGVPASQHVGGPVRELSGRVEIGPPVEGHVHMQPASSAGPDEAGEAELAIEQLTRPQRHAPHVGEVLAIRRIEVEHQLIGHLHLVGAAHEPGISMQAWLAR